MGEKYYAKSKLELSWRVMLSWVKSMRKSQWERNVCFKGRRKVFFLIKKEKSQVIKGVRDATRKNMPGRNYKNTTKEYKKRLLFLKVRCLSSRGICQWQLIGWEESALSHNIPIKLYWSDNIFLVLNICKFMWDLLLIIYGDFQIYFSTKSICKYIIYTCFISC